jgi:hypothetical protein
MKIKVRKLDRRFTGHDKWQYFVDFKPSNYLTEDAKEYFFAVRVWCWEQWGPSREANRYHSSKLERSPELHPEVKDKNPNWSWIIDDYKFRIYLRSLDEAAMFTLKWS